MSKPKPSPTMTSLRALVGASGRSPRDLERGCGVSYRTILRWLKEDPEFITHLEAVLREVGCELAVVRLGSDAAARALGYALARKPRVMRSLAKMLDANRDLLP